MKATTKATIEVAVGTVILVTLIMLVLIMFVAALDLRDEHLEVQVESIGPVTYDIPYPAGVNPDRISPTSSWWTILEPTETETCHEYLEFRMLDGYYDKDTKGCYAVISNSSVFLLDPYYM